MSLAENSCMERAQRQSSRDAHCKTRRLSVPGFQGQSTTSTKRMPRSTGLRGRPRLLRLPCICPLQGVLKGAVEPLEDATRGGDGRGTPGRTPSPGARRSCCPEQAPAVPNPSREGAPSCGGALELSSSSGGSGASEYFGVEVRAVAGLPGTRHVPGCRRPRGPCFPRLGVPRAARGQRAGSQGAANCDAPGRAGRGTRSESAMVTPTPVPTPKEPPPPRPDRLLPGECLPESAFPPGDPLV